MARIEILEIVTLSGSDDCGVYSTVRRGEFGTPLVFRGTEEECIEFVIGDREVIDVRE